MGLLLFLGAPQHPGMLAQLSQLQLWGGLKMLWGLGDLSEGLFCARAGSSSPLAAPLVKKAAPPFAAQPREEFVQHGLSNPYEITRSGPAQLIPPHPTAVFPQMLRPQPGTVVKAAAAAGGSHWCCLFWAEEPELRVRMGTASDATHWE